MRRRVLQLYVKNRRADIFFSMEYHVYWKLKSSRFELFGDKKYGLFLSQEVDRKMIFTDYWEVLVLNFSVMGNTVFFHQKSWWKHDIYVVFLSFLWYSRTWEICFFAQCYYLKHSLFSYGRKLLLWSYLSHSFHKHGVHKAKVYRALIDWLVETQDSSPLINLHRKKTLDGCFHKKLDIHVSSSLPNKQKHSAFTQTKIFLLWWRHHARGINMIIGS